MFEAVSLIRTIGVAWTHIIIERQVLVVVNVGNASNLRLILLLGSLLVVEE